ncbi:MAG: 3-deoxy-8-phosphooctulonate synthase [Crocinitomicaceae bacterium]|nr:3-deoxy-8-phosphooctulonate synthase [Crocinitomicaceae bacterium]|tara:strand:- start:1391 stop:2191 length:801 start_codon:yes stop_codon:yes gene_type:complete
MGRRAFNKISNGRLLVIAGPCAVEGDQILDLADRVVSICSKLELPLVFKGSFKKANRSRIDSFTGIGDEKALGLLLEVATKYNVPITTDVHCIEDVVLAANYVDVIQIPAFLCRQTDLVVAAAKTGKIVNIKKGQFLSAESMKFAVQKVWDSGNEECWITERGTTFGYEDLVIDMKGIPVMKKYAPTVVDLTHSLQKPNQSSGVTGGNPEYIKTLGKAAVAAGADAVFIETHPDPQNAKSDGANMLHLDNLNEILTTLKCVYEAVM